MAKDNMNSGILVENFNDLNAHYGFLQSSAPGSREI